MPVPPWTLIATDARIARLAGLTLALAYTVDDAPEVAVVEFRTGRSVRGRATRCRVTVAQLGAQGRPRRLRVPTWLRLNDFVREHASGAALEKALVVPGARWGTAALFGRGMTTEVAGDRGFLFDASQIVGRLNPSSADDHSPEAARERVARVRETLGAMITDVVHRIEHSALFDSAVPLTREFQRLLMRWDDEQHRLGAAALDRLSFEIALAFDTARDHAATVGLRHLPSTVRPAARRALKGARLARRATSDGEREAALAQVQRILESLALYYLPLPEDVPGMIGTLPELGARP